VFFIDKLDIYPFLSIFSPLARLLLIQNNSKKMEKSSFTVMFNAAR